MAADIFLQRGQKPAPDALFLGPGTEILQMEVVGLHSGNADAESQTADTLILGPHQSDPVRMVQ